MGPIFLFLIVCALLVGFATGRMEALNIEMLEASKSAVLDVALKLIGPMALFLGVVEVLKRAGLMATLAKLLRPLFRRLFPDVPDGHPAISMMTLNMAANMLGLGNAATPFGIEAMRRLDELNGKKGVATNAMCLFLAINTSSVALIPTGVIGIRASLGSGDPAGIWVTSLLATGLSTTVAILAAVLLSRVSWFRRSRPPAAVASDESGAAGVADVEVPDDAPDWIPRRAVAACAIFLAALAAGIYGLPLAESRTATELIRYAASWLPLPLFVLFALLYGWARGVKVYEALVDGAKQGFQIAILIIPYLVAILVAVAMFRASGSLDAIIGAIGPATSALGFPPEALPMALIRPLSGSGAIGVMTETMQAHGTDSFIGYLVSTLNGSTETTFYVLAVYGGAIGLKRTRHALPACLIADLTGVIAATAAVHLLLG